MVDENVVLQSASEVYHENADQQKKVQYKIKKKVIIHRMNNIQTFSRRSL